MLVLAGRDKKSRFKPEIPRCPCILARINITIYRHGPRWGKVTIYNANKKAREYIEHADEHEETGVGVRRAEARNADFVDMILRTTTH